ncbi:hemagglutinin repeat-containing protein [Orbaceae bacterium ac157xtp]
MIPLDAAQDINILGGLNTQHSDRKESHQSASAGVGITVGSNGTGIKFSGSASYSKEREKMDGSAWTESVISAGDKLTVNSGHDTTIVGGQLEGNKVEMNVGNNLNIQSLQDTNNYDYDKISASVNGSFTYGSGNVEANLTLGKTEMESNWASVTDQSGIFAKEGGYDIAVGNNTDLKGAMIASEAKDKANNKLDTGTISFSDIENKADYHVDAVSVSIGTSPTTPGMSYHKSDSDHSTTHSAVEDGELIIRDKENQKQSINDLSHDTANANNPLEQIFDKQEHLDNIEIIETINAISKETISIIDTANKAKAEKARQDEINKNLLAGEADKNENGYSQLTKEEQERYDEQLLANANKAGEEAYDQSLKGSSSAMGSDERKHLNALTNIAKGLITGDITGTIGGVSAPYLAEQIKKYTEGNSEIANKTLHAVLGAAVAKPQGNSAIAGGAGAVTGEVVADIIRDKLYGKEIKDLTEAEKENISALTQLATGLATVASTGGDLNAAGTAISASKNAVENNYLSVDEAIRKAYLTWIKPNYVGEKLTEDEKKELENLNKLDKERDQILKDNCFLGNISSSACKGLLQEAWEIQKEYEKEAARNLKYADIYREDSKNLNEALIGLDPNNIIHLISIEAIAEKNGQDVKDVARQYRYVMAAHGIVSSLAGLYGGVKLTSSGKFGVDAVTVYRVEGAPNTRVIIGNNGEVTITGNTTLYLNFGDKARAQAFLEKRLSQNMDGATIKSFEVSKSFLDEIKKNAIFESEVKFNKDKPVIADPTKADDQYGIRPNQFDELKNSIIQGSGKDGSK